MRKIIFILIVLIAFPAFAANKNKKIKEEVLEDWYIYKYMFQDGYRIPRTSQCAKSKVSLAESIEILDKNRIDYKLIEQVTHKDKPTIVDIQTFDEISNSGYDYAYRIEYVYVTRFVKGEKQCNEYRTDDLAGKLSKNRIDRYK